MQLLKQKVWKLSGVSVPPLKASKMKPVFFPKHLLPRQKNSLFCVFEMIRNKRLLDPNFLGVWLEKSIYLQNMIHPWSLTAGSPENDPLEKEIPALETIIFRFYVKLWGCTNLFGWFPTLDAGSPYLWDHPMIRSSHAPQAHAGSSLCGTYRCGTASWLSIRKSTNMSRFSGDSWMYPYQRTPMGNPYISPLC